MTQLMGGRNPSVDFSLHKKENTETQVNEAKVTRRLTRNEMPRSNQMGPRSQSSNDVVAFIGSQSNDTN